MHVEPRGRISQFTGSARCQLPRPELIGAGTAPYGVELGEWNLGDLAPMSHRQTPPRTHFSEHSKLVAPVTAVIAQRPTAVEHINLTNRSKITSDLKVPRESSPVVQWKARRVILLCGARAVPFDDLHPKWRNPSLN